MIGTQIQILLSDKLVVLTDEQYQAVFALYGNDGLEKYDTLVKDNGEPELFQSELASLIEKDTNQEQKSKLTALLEKYYEDYNAEKANLETLVEAAAKANLNKNEFKKTFNMNVATFTNNVKELVSASNKQILEQRRLQQEASVAWEKREKIRQRGKKAYLRALVAAVIDECDEQYRAEVVKDVPQIIKSAKVVISSGNLVYDPKSALGTDEVMSYCFPRKKNEDLTQSKSLSQIEAVRNGLKDKPKVNR